MKTSEALRAALAILDGGKRWIQGEKESCHGYCAIGAIDAVIGRVPGAVAMAEPVITALYRQLPESATDVASYNDSYGWVEIEAVFLAAINQAIEDEQTKD